MPKWAAILLIGTLMSALIACSDEDRPGDKPPRAPSKYSRIVFEKLDLENRTNPDSDTIHTRLLSYELTKLGQVDTVPTPDGRLRAARGERFYAGQFRVTVNERYLEELRKKWRNAGKVPYWHHISVEDDPKRPFGQRDMKTLLTTGNLPQSSFTVVAAAPTTTPDGELPSFEVAESASDPDIGADPELQWIALVPDGGTNAPDIEPAFVPLTKTYRHGQNKNLGQYSEDELFHEVEFLSAESAQSTDLARIPEGKGDSSLLLVRARWRFEFDTNLKGGYHYKDVARLVGADGTEYENVGDPQVTKIEFDDFVTVKSDSKMSKTVFVFNIPRDERSFTLHYTPTVAIAEYDPKADDAETFDLGSQTIHIELPTKMHNGGGA